MEYSTSRIRLRKPSPVPPQRISISSQYKNNHSPILTPRRKIRTISLRRKGTTKAPNLISRDTDSQGCRTTQPHQYISLPQVNEVPETGLELSALIEHDDSAINANSTEWQVYDDASSPRREPSPSTIADDIFAPLSSTHAISSTPAEVVSHPVEKIHEKGYELFFESVISGGLSFYQISKKTFVANGWNSHKSEASAYWYHIHASMEANTKIVVCLCPDSKRTSSCFHSRFILEHGDTYFPDEEHIPLNHDKPAFILRYPWGTESDQFVNVMSIPPPRDATIKNCTVVEYTGKDDGSGKWSCALDTTVTYCTHIAIAKKCLQQHVQKDMNAKDVNPIPSIEARKVQRSRNQSTLAYSGISRLPVPPPVWARIPSDSLPYPKVDPIRRPAIIPLGHTSSCNCLSPRRVYDPSAPSCTQKCTVYDLSMHWETEIELQRCPSCNFWRIGPDCNDMGIFNYNNDTLVTHSLLNDYINSYTASETPIAAWLTVISRRYSTLPTPQFFLDPELFRIIWFAYVELIQFGDDMMCPKCGPNPAAVIWDGVSISFSQKMVLPTLRPPTTIHPDSSVYDTTVRVKETQCVTDRGLRKRIREILNGPSLAAGLEPYKEGEEPGSDSDAEEARGARAEALAKKKEGLKKRFQLIPEVVEDLTKLDDALGDLFQKHFGMEAVLRKISPPHEYKDLFLQIAAEENALQMMHAPSLTLLRQFFLSPSYDTGSALIHIPSIYHVVQYELQQHSRILPDTLKICRWLYTRGEAVRRRLLVHSTPEITQEISTDSSDWKKTGCYYGMPQVRNRPTYPSLKEDTKDSAEDQKGGCRKYYSTYSAKRLTGGIMVCWCSHSVAYGFHCIPVGEGRNDVFSAMYSMWTKAPEVVVYDFACALQPYCVLREPEFFQNTLFTIDDFHAADHTKCAAACFLKTYKNSDPRLLRINSSAAECGNRGLSRIRKSIAFMGQERGVVFIKVFLSVWNRLRIVNMSI